MSSVWQDYEVFAPTAINKSKFMAEESSMRLELAVSSPRTARQRYYMA